MTAQVSSVSRCIFESGLNCRGWRIRGLCVCYVLRGSRSLVCSWSSMGRCAICGRTGMGRSTVCGWTGTGRCTISSGAGMRGCTTGRPGGTLSSVRASSGRRLREQGWLLPERVLVVGPSSYRLRKSRPRKQAASNLPQGMSCNMRTKHGTLLLSYWLISA